MMLFLPELTLLGAALVIFFVAISNAGSNTIKNVVLALGALTVGATLLSVGLEGDLFFQTYRIDLFSQSFKVLISIALFAVLLFGSRLQGLHTSIHAEYYLCLFVSVLGLMMLVSSVELLAIFVSLELSSFAVYIMVPMRDDSGRFRFQMEAGAKYLLFGVIATGFMLFGMSYLYGLTGSTHLDVLVAEMPALLHMPAAVVAIVLVLCGFFYKLAIFPFHFWVPDVYEGAANETTSFIATVPKIAAVALLLRIVTMIDSNGETIVNLLMVCSILSMFYGNLSALVQKDLKRMLGFSGIAHAGFVLLGLLVFHITGYSHALYYIAGYVVMNLACFLVICSVANNGENVLIEDLNGLYKRSPLLALTLLIGLFALAGIPPFVGFMGKFFILVDALRQDYLLLVTLAAINTAIAIYYYLSVVRVAFCSSEEELEPIATPVHLKMLSVVLMAVILIMGVFPSRFIHYAETTIQSIM
ncbi:MAG: NADH-quinone oxidoreductase subunit N [Desulfopila sp.]|jgi:NADH-quinone oxidoreductase subunit N|nr:NADH-quinone oxidoreductase subunit N [Desulfopila sp.]